MLAVLAAVLAAPARADGVPDLIRQYPERAPDGTVRVVAAWNDGTYSFLVRAYAERRPDGQAAKVYQWNNGRYTCVLREYPEERLDAIHEVQYWCNASWHSWQVGCKFTDHPDALTRGGLRPSPFDPAIKGNIAFETGERIYHVSGGEFYRATVIREEYGERWFCTEAGARAAG